MSRIFLSHSSVNNAEAIAVRDWMRAQGWDDVFLDLDPERGLVAGDRWQEALKAAVNRCELVIIIVSPEWAASRWCQAEFLLTKHGGHPKAILPVIVSPTPFSDLPGEMTAEYQSVDLTAGERSVHFTVTLPPGDKTATVAFSELGLLRLKIGIGRSGVDAKHFDWPPASDPSRPPYRGLAALEADDAGIFFGRDAQVIAALDQLRSLREAAPPRLLVILGASGAGKSSFMRAGVLPRLMRDDRHFLALPVIRPERAILSGDNGLLRSLVGALLAANLPATRADLRAAIDGGAAKLRPLLRMLVERAMPPAADPATRPKPPTLILAIDQAEELFLAEGQEEARAFLALLRDLLLDDSPAVAALFTIRSDNYERLQLAKELDGVRQATLSLPPMPKGAYAEVIKGPVRRLEDTPRKLEVDDALVQALLTDIETGSAKDSLPLLAFTMERLYGDYSAGGHLEHKHYLQLGGIAGSIEAAVEHALKRADEDQKIPKERKARLALLRRGLIPWIAGIDHETGAPRRRVARLSEIPAESRPMVQHLVEARLLSTDIANGSSGETTVEPAHEALLRQWGLLGGWLKEDSALLSVIDGVQRGSRDWDDNRRSASWLTHTTGRLEAAEKLSDRPDLAALLGARDSEYLADCRKSETASTSRSRRARALTNVLMVTMIVGLVGWINQALVKQQWNEFTVIRPYMQAHIRPHVLSAEAERALKPQASFRECAKDCPEMIVVPDGSFMMGSPPTEKGHNDGEGPQQQITFAKPFAVSRFPVTFADWDACSTVGGCPPITDSGYGRGNKPIANVNWDEAKQYVAWLARVTGQPYRLPTDAEWEYAARAGTTTAYPWGDEIGKGNANCSGCGSKWDKKETSPVGSFKPNDWGLFDMHGNVFHWVQDCHAESLDKIPADGSAAAEAEACRRGVRGGSWDMDPVMLRSANRGGNTTNAKYFDLSFRIARTIAP